MSDYQGILFVGDTHLASRTLDFRKDDYPRESLKDLIWCLEYAQNKKLLPALLGDVFHWPRDNANWLLGELLQFLHGREVVCIYGNHDCQENSLTEHDSLKVLVQAKALRLLTHDTPWLGTMLQRNVMLGGTSWGIPPPETVVKKTADQLTFWMTHHDWLLPGYDGPQGPLGKLKTNVLHGVDLVVNGHIHRNLQEFTVGNTLWLNPGSIARVSRSDATRLHQPAVLRVDITRKGWSHHLVKVPHRPFMEVFHEAIVDEKGLPLFDNHSSFIHGLKELQARRTETGAGLASFLEQNMSQFSEPVQKEISSLAKEVLQHVNNE